MMFNGRLKSMTASNGSLKNIEFGINMKNNKDMKVEIDPDTADGIVRASLKQTIEYFREDISDLKKKKKLEDYQKRELADLIVSLDAIEKTFDYYGGNLK
jgi:hypothetical protein